jgi:hypothetical protein
LNIEPIKNDSTADIDPFKDKQESCCFQISVEKDVVGRGAIRSMLTPFLED